MLTVHHVNAVLVIAVCAAAGVGALVARRRGAAGWVAHLLALAQTLLVAQVGLGLRRLRAPVRCRAVALCAGRSADTARLVRGRDARRRGPRGAGLHDGMKISPFVRGMLIIAAISLLVVVLNLETALSTAGVLLRLGFFLAIALVAYLFWRDFGRREIGLWQSRQQWVFYGAVALLVVDLGWFFIVGVSGVDALVFFVVAGVCVYAGVRTWRDQRRYG
jgi:hypothetical protein